jgi:hypothetical protein
LYPHLLRKAEQLPAQEWTNNKIRVLINRRWV